MFIRSFDKGQLTRIFLFLLFIGAPFIDAMNGYLVLNGISSEGGSGSIGQIYRLFMFCLSFLIIGCSRKLVFLFFIFSYFFILEVTGFLLHKESAGFFIGIIYANKILYIISIFYALTKAVEMLGQKYVIRIFLYSSVLYAFILLGTTLIGINSPTYANGGGTKGVFASGNGLSIFLGAASIIAYSSYCQNKDRMYLYIFLLVLSACIAVGTKASIVFLFVGLGAIFYNTSKKLKLVIILISVSLFFYNIDFSYFLILFDVINTRYENSASLFHFLASSRDIFFQHAYSQYIIDGLFSFRVLFGLGVFVSYRDPLSPIGPYDTLESDFLDIFYMYGMFGMFAYLALWSFILLRFIKLKMSYLLIVTLCTLGYSLIAGHVLFNAMSSMIISILLLLSISNKKTGNYER